MKFSAEKVGPALISLGSYAIVDVTKGSSSEGKILVLLDDEDEAREIADELCRRGCSVDVRTIRRRRPNPIRTPGQEDLGVGSAASAVAI